MHNHQAKTYVMIIKSSADLAIYKEACAISMDIMSQLKEAIKVDVYPRDLDKLADELCKKHNVRPSFRGVPGHTSRYAYATCISVNDTVLHGIPDDKRKLIAGDVVKVDFGLVHKGFFTDHCFSVGVKRLSAEDEKLVKTTRDAVQAAVKLVKAGNTTGMLGHAMQRIAEQNGFNVLKEYIGHGIGKSLHDSPAIPAYGQPFEGSKLKDGMVICVEAQLVTGGDQVFTAQDGWSVKTVDGGRSAMFEYMVLVKKDGYEVLTDTMDWGILAG